MKWHVIALTALLATAPVWADKETLIDYDDKWNLFSKFELGLPPVGDEDGTVGAITAGGLLNSRFGIGLTAQMLVTSVDLNSPIYDDPETSDFMAGGAYLEYVFFPDSMVHVSLDLMVGAAQLDLTRTVGGSSASETVWVVEPGLNLMVNITETFMFGLGAAYRMTDDITLVGLEEDALSGFVGSAFLRFTQF